MADAEAFLDAMRSIVRDDLVHGGDIVRGGDIVLRENDPAAHGPATRIRTKNSTLVLRLDACATPGGLAVDDRLFPLLRPDSGLRANCDYVIACARKMVLHILLFELKTSTSAGAFGQILNTRILIDGLLDAVRLHRQPAEPDRVVYRGVILTGSTKRPKGDQCPFNKHDPRDPDLRGVILPAAQEYFMPYFCQ